MGENAKGRPLAFETAEELQQAIDEYWKECKDNEEIPTIAGLAYHLKVDRQTIYNYEKKSDYFDTIKNARDYIISRIEKKLMNSNGNVAGSIFLAKNYGYTDRQDITINEKLKKSDLDELDDLFGEDD